MLDQESEATTDPVQVPEKRHKRLKNVVVFMHASLWGRLLLGLILAGTVLVIKTVFIEPQEWYEQVRLKTYEQVQNVLSSRRLAALPVALVDITNIPRINDASVSPGGPAVCRDCLLASLTNIAQDHRVAIAVDVDFSAGLDGNPVTLKDPEYFAEFRKLEHDTGVPIFLGVDRMAASPEADWLGGIDNEGLAVGLAVGNDKYQAAAADMKGPVGRVLRMFCWTRVDGVPTQLKSLAFACSQAANADSQEPPGWLQWALKFHSTYAPESGLETEGFLVDYGILGRLLKPKTSIFDVSPAKSGQFKGKVVVLGVVREVKDTGQILGRNDDLFRVPGKATMVYSGALLHGCGIDTLIESPLRQWTPIGRVASDLTLVATAIGLIELFCWLFYFRRERHHHDFRIHWSVTLIIVAAVGAISIPFAATFRLVWDDAAFVMLGLAAHTGLDHWLAHYVHPRAPNTVQSEATEEPEYDETLVGATEAAQTI